VRSLILSLLLLLALPGAAGAQGGKKKASPHEADVIFLLEEIEKQAGQFFQPKGIDWKAASREFRAAARKVRTDEEHLKLCARLLARLEDGHAGIVESKVKWPDESRGRRWTGPRVLLLVLEDRVFVRASFKEAKTRGIEPGMEVVKIDGQPARKWLDGRVAAMREKGEGFSTDHQALYAACHQGLADWEGKPIAFELRGLDGRGKKVTIVRSGGPNYAPIGPLFPPEGLKSLGRQSYGRTAGGLGYIHLRDVPGELPGQLDAMLEEIGDVRGLILDMRGNGGGGCDHEAVFGRFVESGKRWRQYTGQGRKPFTGPMVVIIDSGVRSAGETVAGMLKEDGRAYVIGDGPTAGMSSQKSTLTVPSGLFTVRFSVHSNKARFNGGKGIEGIGVGPHEVVAYDPRDLAKGEDTLILRAAKILEGGIPGGAVAYPGAR
jgi:hypothetical protein